MTSQEALILNFIWHEMEYPKSNFAGRKVICSLSTPNAAQPFSKATVSSHAKFLETGEISNLYSCI